MVEGAFRRWRRDLDCNVGLPLYNRTRPTLGTFVAGDVVVLADELVVVKDVELLSGGELLPAYHAGEAVEVEDFVPRFTDEVRRGDPLKAATAFGAITPVQRNK